MGGGLGGGGDWKDSFRASRRDAAPAPTQPGGFEAIRTALHTERLWCQRANFLGLPTLTEKAAASIPRDTINAVLKSEVYLILIEARRRPGGRK